MADLVLEVGKEYKTRIGDKVKIIRKSEDPKDEYPIKGLILKDYIVYDEYSWMKNGRYISNVYESIFDLVAEWDEWK